MDVSDKKIAANRENAKKSTGPKTPRGKAIASLNAMTHGVFAKHAVSPGPPLLEEQIEFVSLLEGFRTQYEPVGVYEDVLVQEIAVAKWKSIRLERYETAGVSERLSAAMESGRSRVAEEQWTLIQKGFRVKPGSVGDPNERPLVTSKELQDQIDLVERLGTGEIQIESEPYFLAFVCTEQLGPGATDAVAGASEDQGRIRLSQLQPKDLEELKARFRPRMEKLLEVMRDLRAKTVPLEAAIERSLVPDGEEIDKIIRYSTYLSRLEERKTELLDRLQARRRKANP